jgi:hypothetical protein
MGNTSFSVSSKSSFVNGIDDEELDEVDVEGVYSGW